MRIAFFFTIPIYSNTEMIAISVSCVCVISMARKAPAPAAGNVEMIEFETADPVLRATMTLTTTLTDAAGGTDVVIVHEGIPDSVPLDDNEAGTRMALANLAKLVERS